MGRTSIFSQMIMMMIVIYILITVVNWAFHLLLLLLYYVSFSLLNIHTNKSTSNTFP